MSRLRDLFSYRCFERRVLLNFAAMRNGVVALGSALLLDWQAEQVGGFLGVLLMPCNAVLLALILADWVEHYGRLLVLGYAYNPNVSARCELEGGNMPAARDAERAWRTTMFTRIAVGDDPGPGHYPYPIDTFTGRLRAIFEGAA